MAPKFRKLFDKVFNKRKGAEKKASNGAPVTDRANTQTGRNDAESSTTTGDPLNTTAGANEPETTVASNQPSSTPTVDDDDKADIHGMFTFVDKRPEEPDIVDIVALHGLNGHYRKTWSTMGAAGGRVNWLKDLIPRYIPNARIMSFGYNSSVQFSKSTSDIGNFADGLLADLMSCRNSEEEKCRPLIFICHSLGGIVFKQALVRARERDRFTDLLKHIRGVAFFGTPHAGSTSAKFGKVLASILKASTLGVNTNSKLVADLKNNSETLRGITKSFVDRSKALRILSFYETEKMDSLNFQVVEETSAMLNLPNENAVPISGNHVNMCKFSDSQAGLRKFQRVWSHLKEMVDELNSTEVSYITNLSRPEQLECLRGFYHENYESFRNRNPDRVAGTCEWFLRHPEYQTWRMKESSSLLWVSADPGCGKSVLAKFLVEHLKQPESKQDRPELVCHFFFKDDSDEQRNSVLALRALLHQIFSDNKALLRHAFLAFESKGLAMLNDFESMWDILSSITMDSEATNLLIILDGLDECEKVSQTKLLTSLNKLYRQKTLNEKPFFKVILLSRPENNIKSSFSHNLATVRLRGEDETEAISGDVELVVRSHVNELESQGLPRGLLSGLQDALIERADRTFLWTTLMIELLKDAAISGASQRELEELLENRNIDSIYAKLLERSMNVDNSRKLLQLVLAAARPLTLDELNIALAVCPQQLTFEELKANLKHPMENYVKTTCGHFIRVIRSEVYLVHQTAREFLLQRRQPEGETPLGTLHHLLIPEDCESTLLRSCISYLFLLAVAQDEDLEVFQFFDYATTLWPKHFKDANDVIFDQIVDVTLRQCAKSPQRTYQWLLAHDLIVHLDNWRFFPAEVPGEVRLAIAQLLDKLILRLLGDNSVHVQATDSAGKTLLHYASTTGSLRTVTTLVNMNLDVSALDNEGNTPLHLLATGRKGMSKMLLNPDIQRRIIYHRPTEWSCIDPPPVTDDEDNEGSEDIETRRYSGKRDQSPQSLIYFPSSRASEDNDDTKSVDAGQDIESRGQAHQWLPFRSRSSSVAELDIEKRWVVGDIIRVLVAHGADINAVTDEGKTPLHLASEVGAPEAVEWLLSNGADINAKNARLGTALHSAIESGKAGAAGAILNYNPDQSQVNCNGETAFQVMKRRPTIDSSVAARLAAIGDNYGQPHRNTARSVFSSSSDSSSKASSMELL